MAHHQIRRAQLALHRDRDDEQDLKTLFLAQANSLPGGRPEPRCPWDDIARGRNPHPNYKGVEHSRRVIRDALKTGDRDVIQRAALDVEAYWDGCKAAALSGIPSLAELSPVSTYRAVVKESTEAVSAAVAFREDPSLVHHAAREIKEMIAAGQQFLASLHHPRAKAAVR